MAVTAAFQGLPVGHRQGEQVTTAGTVGPDVHRPLLDPSGHRSLIEALGNALAPDEYNGKGTIRFALVTPVPAARITRIARFRGAEEAARHCKRMAAKKR